MNQQVPETLGRRGVEEILAQLPNDPAARIQTGVSFIFSPFRTPPETTVKALTEFLMGAEETSTPVLVQIDLEHWWEARPDLWNWWDAAKPGFNLANRENVEWLGWSSADALRIAWRNWGRQIRVLPPPNLASPRYVTACREEIRRLVPIVLNWHERLPAEKKHLLVGIKLGHETSIGVNAYHFPGGNALLAKPSAEDPQQGLKNDDVPARGMQPMGFAALKTSGMRGSGAPPTGAELASVAHRYLDELCAQAAELGVPRERLFAHGAGWQDDEPFHAVPVNAHSCPAWSFYKWAADPRQDIGVKHNLARSDAPFWAATEWLLAGPRDLVHWRQALTNTLADPRCRYVCVFNWESIRDSPPVLAAVKGMVNATAEDTEVLLKE